jgi:hypothetical protein
MGMNNPLNSISYEDNFLRQKRIRPEELMMANLVNPANMALINNLLFQNYLTGLNGLK